MKAFLIALAYSALGALITAPILYFGDFISKPLMTTVMLFSTIAWFTMQGIQAIVPKD